MSDVFRNIDPPPPHRPASVSPPPALVRRRTHSLGGDGWGRGVNSSEDARHCSVLYSIYVSTLCDWHSQMPLYLPLSLTGIWIDEWMESYGFIAWLGCMDTFLCCSVLR
jgi:hypothetical protein